VCHHLDGGVKLAADKGSWPWFCGDERYHHVDFTDVQAMGHRQATMVDRDVSIVAEMKECVI
jgi:hypothetical protein